MKALTFHTTQFDIIDRDGHPWLRLPQIGGALGYADAGKAINKIFTRNADEFTSSMTALVELDTAGGRQQVRIFSLRGVHLLAMLSRTKVAKEFRRWVLDVLEGTDEAPAKRQPKLLPNGLSADQQEVIKALVKARVDELPEGKRAKAAITCWSSLKSKFGCTYKEISPEQFTDAVSLVARVALEGELLAPERTAPALHYPATMLLELNPHLRSEFGKERICLGVDSLCGMDVRSPTLKLIGELSQAGHDMEGCRLEVLAMRHHLESYWRLSSDLRRMGEAHSNAGFSFPLR